MRGHRHRAAALGLRGWRPCVAATGSSDGTEPRGAAGCQGLLGRQTVLAGAAGRSRKLHRAAGRGAGWDLKSVADVDGRLTCRARGAAAAGLEPGQVGHGNREGLAAGGTFQSDALILSTDVLGGGGDRPGERDAIRVALSRDSWPGP